MSSTHVLSTDNLLVSTKGHVTTLKMNRPAQKNALSGALVKNLTKAFRELNDSPETYVIVLTGGGDGEAFCAGGDLAEQQHDPGAAAAHLLRGYFADLLVEMQRSAKPIVARVNGHALGGGFGLMLQCDLVVAKTGVKMGTPEVRAGLFPMMIMAVLMRHVGRKQAMEMMLTGDLVPVEQAFALGLINKVAGEGELDEVCGKLVDKLAGYSPMALQLGRRAFYQAEDLGFESSQRLLHHNLTLLAQTDDAKEGVRAFLEKRAPKWTGR